jgi:hypothetical protein
MIRQPISTGNVAAELRRRQEADLERRRGASTILTPEAVRPGAKSALGVLMTTLGGSMRPITSHDLAAFRRNIASVAGGIAKGLTVQELIDASRAEDLERARRQIRQAAPSRLTQGTVMFVTNSGPESRVRRHVVHFVFDNYGAAVARPEKALEAASWLAREGRLRFECTCERFTFWYRYIATIGGFVAGRPESGFPKIRNPQLTGVACKHLLRAAIELQGSFVRQSVARMIQADRDRLDAKRGHPKPRVITASRPDVERLLQQQSRRARSIETSDDRERKAVLASLRASLPKGSGGTRNQLRSTLAALEARSDVSAQAILAALQGVLRQSGAAL